MSNHRKLFKAAALLGGSQVILTLIGMVRNKLMAVLLGPSGVGLSGLYTSITTLAGTLTNFGLGGSGIRQLAEANGAGDQVRVARTVIVIKRTVLVSSTVAALAVGIFCRPISVATFGDAKYASGVALMGLVLVFSGVSFGQLAVLQGLQRMRALVNCQILGAVLGSVVSVGIVWWLRERGVAWFLVTNAAFAVLASWWFVRQIKLVPVQVSLPETLQDVRQLARLGIGIVVMGLAGSFVAYLTRIIIIHKLGMPASGQYQAAFTLSSIYVGFILNAISTDFFPRLSSLAGNHPAANRLINEQIEIGLLLATPGIIATLVLAPWILRVLYTGDFVAAAGIVQWQVIGVFFRMVGSPLWHIQLAKGRGGLLVLTETLAAGVQILLNWFCIARWGLDGIGVGSLLFYLLQAIAMYWLCRRLSDFVWSRQVLLSTVAGLLLLVSAFAAVRLLPGFWGFGLGLVFCLVTATTSFVVLQKVLGLNIIQVVLKRLAPRSA